MSYTLYHGCIKSAVEPITHGEYGLEHGNNKIVHPWSCADGDTIFFHDATLMKESECIYDDDNETAIQYCIERCNEQAQIQNACLPHPFDVTCVLEITFYTDSFDEPINSWDDICVLDDSCPNMPTAVCMWADTFNQLVEEGRVSFKVYEFEFFPKLALCYIAGLATTSPLFNKKCLSENELKACEMISREGYYFEDLFMPNSVDYYKIEPVNLKNFKKDF